MRSPDQFPHVRAPVAIALGLAIAIGATVNVAADAHHAAYDPNRINRCFDAPQPAAKSAEATLALRTAQATAPTPHLAVDANNVVDGISRNRPNAELDKILRENTMQIHTFVGQKGSERFFKSGSGFVIKFGGDQWLVTAGHVAGDYPINDIEVLNAKRQVSPVLGGCYLFEDNGRFTALDHAARGPGVDTDVAVLKLGIAMTDEPLALSEQPPQLGQQDTAYNYQAGSPLDAPATIPAVVGKMTVDGLIPLLSGLEPDDPQLQNPREHTRIVSGSSGGMLVNNETGTVDGVTVSGHRIDYVDTPPEILGLSGIVVEGPGLNDLGRPGNLSPSVSYAVPTRYITLALSSYQR